MPGHLLRNGALLLLIVLFSSPAARQSARAQPTTTGTTTPIQHLVVIFQENISFDHYFGTYPTAMNPPGEPAFTAAPGTPAVDGLSTALLTANPNRSNPFRFSRNQALTCDQDHGYTDEQKAFNSGAMDKFVEYAQGKVTNPAQFCPSSDSGAADVVMGYYDGNTVTALWNYAQNFAMSDNSYSTGFGPSSPGAVNLVAADTSGVVCGPQGNAYGDMPACGAKNDPHGMSAAGPVPSNGSTGSLIGDARPFFDVCSANDASTLAVMSGRNIGDLLNAAGVSWGWFQGGFGADGPACDQKHAPEASDRAAAIDPATDTNTAADYIMHHEPFQYYPSTANPQHLPPSSADMVGKSDQAKHQYDLTWFWTAADTGALPAVSFLKAAAYQDGHAAYSDPLDEQQFLVETINHLEKLPTWDSTAVIILYDDSDGWYDHVASPRMSDSNTSVDFDCGTTNTMGVAARCGFGPRQPLLVISGYARKNYVSHTLTDQSSVLRFIEDNWLGGQRISDKSFDGAAGSLLDMLDFSQAGTHTLFLDPITGLPAAAP